MRVTARGELRQSQSTRSIYGLFHEVDSLTSVCAGNTYAPDGDVIDHSGIAVAQPGDVPTLSQMAACCALCNDSTLYYAPDKALPPPSPRASNGPSHRTNVGQVCQFGFACEVARRAAHSCHARSLDVLSAERCFDNQISCMAALSPVCMRRRHCCRFCICWNLDPVYGSGLVAPYNYGLLTCRFCSAVLCIKFW